MSDPVSNMDVEDVLSSIRRLVSEEAKGDPSGRQAAAKPEARGFRPEIELDDLAEQVPMRKVPEPTKQNLRRQPEPDNLSFRRAANTVREDHVGVPPSNDFSAAADPVFTPEAPKNAVAQKLVLTDAFRVEEENSLATALADEPLVQAPPKTSLRRVPSQRSETSEASADSPEALLRRTTSRPKPFQFSSDDTLFERATKAMDALKKPETGKPTGQTVERPANSSPNSVADSVENYLSPDEISPVEQLLPEVERLQPVEEEAADDVQADQPVKADEVAPLSEPAEIEEPSTINFVEEEEPMLDEETLRDMISDMVREELQGELGDRITRNVRKLVRREIQRAITSREFE